MKARVLVKSYLNGKVYKPGEIVEVEKLDDRLEALNPVKNGDKDEKPVKGK